MLGNQDVSVVKTDKVSLEQFASIADSIITDHDEAKKRSS